MTEKVEQNSITHGESEEMTLGKLAVTVDKLAGMCSGQFLAIDERFEQMDKKFTGLFVDLKETIVGAVVVAVGAEVRKLNYRAEIDGLDKRVLKLEQAAAL